MMHKTGDWKRVAMLIGAFKKEWQRSKIQSLRLWSLKAEGTAKKHISAQDLGWQALKPETVERKIKAGYSENILVQSSDYFQAITSWVNSVEGKAYAGVRKSAKNAQGDEIGLIAKVHEFGSNSGTIPARPLWQPTFEETLKWFLTSKSRPDVLFYENIKKYYK